LSLNLALILASSFGLLSIASTDASVIGAVVPGAEPTLLKYGSMGILILVLGWVIKRDRDDRENMRKEHIAEREIARLAHEKERKEAHDRWSADINKLGTEVQVHSMKLESLKEKISDSILSHKAH